MKTHTNNFKKEIKLYGKQLDSKIIYPSLSGTVELGVNELNSITPHYEGGILKSVMRGLTIDSNVEIPKGTMLNYQFGVLVNGTFEYINFGNYIVDTIEKQEDTNSYLIECCDKMLYSMVDYEALEITYPITVRNYINAICTKLGLTFKNASDTFANYDKEIPSELYTNIGYTYRNVLDELAQVTASTICINEVDDELEIRYINQTMGKNLFDKDNINILNGYFEYSGDVIHSQNANRVFYIKCNPNTTYAFTQPTSTLSNHVFQVATTNNKPVVGETVYGFKEYWRTSTFTYTTNNTAQFLAIRIRSGDAVNTFWEGLQIEENDVATPYEPYGFGDTIDEEYLKDVNVNFGEKYGPVNSIVLTRAGGSDSVYLKDQESIDENGLCELKIEDNQIMNLNDRADYLPDILEVLDGFEYYTNDFSSTGICYYDLCDRYNVQVGENTYSCVMFNDEVDVTQGLEEIIHTDMPEESETEYKYTSKDDRTINQAYVIAKKADAEVQALASKIVDVSNTISGTHTIQLENAHEGILHRLEISGNLSATFPSNDTYPSNNLYPSVCGIWVYDVKQDAIDWETSKYYVLDFLYLNYINEQVHDTYVYEDGKQWVERNVGIDEFGNKYALQETIIEQGEDIEIRVSKESYITMYPFGDYDNAIFKCTYLLENEYTSTFANQVEVTSELNLLGDTLEAKVSQVADEDGNVTSASIILAVNNDESQAVINADKVSLEGKEINLTSDDIVIESTNFSVDKDGKITATAGEIGGFSLDDTKLYVEYAPEEQIFTLEDYRKVQAYIIGTGTLTPEEFEKYDVNHDGIVNSLDALKIYKNIYYSKGANFQIDSSNFDKFISMEYDNERTVQIGPKSAILPSLNVKGSYFTLSKPSGYSFLNFQNDTSMSITLDADEYQACLLNCTYNSQQKIYVDFQTGEVRCVSLTQTSKEEYKKNFERLDNALDIIKNIDIYKYNMKTDKDTDKKHIGFVIGDGYNYSKEITSKENNTVDLYSFISVCCKAIQEQQEEINLLKQEINLLKERIDK